MSVAVAVNNSSQTASINGSSSSDIIDVVALVPQANNPVWAVEIRPGDGNDTVYGGLENDIIYASPGNDVSYGGGDARDGQPASVSGSWDTLLFDLSSLNLTGVLSVDPSGPSQSIKLTTGGTSTTLFTITLNADGSSTVDGVTPQTQAAFGRETSTNVEKIQFTLGGAKGPLVVINGMSGNDWLAGTPDDDVTYGFDGDDTIWGGVGGTNYLYGGAGRDLLIGGAGIDHMDGGTGVDTASYQVSNAPVTASLADPSINTGDAAGDTYVNIRQLTGTLFGSTLYGDNTGQQNELFAIGGTNYLYGGTGYATLVSGPGADHMFAGAGGGFADYETSKTGLTASLADSSINTGEAAGDTYSNVHDICGSDFDDVLYGDNVGNNMVGNAGNDYMSAGAGNDTLTGGPGANTLIGGSGTDFFVFNAVKSILQLDPLAVLADARAGIYSRIVDFNQGNSGSYNKFEGDSIHIETILPGLFAQGNAPVDSFARIIEDSSNSFSWFQVRDSQGTWLTIARLDGTHVGDTVGVVASASGAVTNIDVLRSGFLVDIGTHGVSWPISGIGDFNADGHSDILWRSPSTGQVDQWQMKDGGWNRSIDLGATKPSDWTLAGVGDFNGDGTSDILWRKISTSQVDQWEMKNGNWSKSIDLGATKGSDWTLAGVGDFNGDGTTDVLWRNLNTSQVDQWEMKNGNWLKSIDLGATKGTDWIVAGIGDFNKDGTSDILWFNKVNGQEEYWAMKGGNWGGSVNLGNLSSSLQPAGVGDFNHDGASDALWLDPASGHLHEQTWMI